MNETDLVSLGELNVIFTALGLLVGVLALLVPRFVPDDVKPRQEIDI